MTLIKNNILNIKQKNSNMNVDRFAMPNIYFLFSFIFFENNFIIFFMNNVETNINILLLKYSLQIRESLRITKNLTYIIIIY